jgi:hypothetical protein
VVTVTHFARRTAWFALGWTALSVVFNLRYPGTDSWWSPFLPSVDATVVLAVYAIGAYARRRIPAAFTAAVAVATVLVRLLRVGDGITRRFFNWPLDLAFDLTALPDLMRLLDSTVPRLAWIGGVLVVLLLLVGIGVVVARILRGAEQYFSDRRGRIAFAAPVAVALVISAFIPPAAHSGPRVGAFGPSVVPFAVKQVRSFASVDRRRAEARAEIRRSDDRLQHAPRKLGRLHGAHVFLFLIESYGATVIDRPDLARDIQPVYDATARVLAGAGFDLASGLLSSPTTGGRSWLAQETVATGVRATDRVVDSLVQQQRPTTMARIFRDAGYRTVFVQPGTTHRGLDRWSYDFETVYSAWDLDYRGPNHGWAPVPDQYTLDFVRRREMARAAQPLLVEVAFVSSHAPWHDQPPIVTDWDQIGDGRVFASLPAVRFPIGWTNISDAGGAYVHAISYDLQILAQFIVKFVPGDSLVILIGDHQPIAEITRWSDSNAVPIHVISRNRALVEAFRARGYRSGMQPAPSASPPGLETLLPDLLADLSASD